MPRVTFGRILHALLVVLIAVPLAGAADHPVPGRDLALRARPGTLRLLLQDPSIPVPALDDANDPSIVGMTVTVFGRTSGTRATFTTSVKLSPRVDVARDARRRRASLPRRRFRSRGAPRPHRGSSVPAGGSGSRPPPRASRSIPPSRPWQCGSSTARSVPAPSSTGRRCAAAGRASSSPGTPPPAHLRAATTTCSRASVRRRAAPREARRASAATVR